MASRDPFRYFRVEARELLDGLNLGVLELERGGEPGETVKRLLRLAHTLKGAARVVRLPHLADLAHRVEEALQGAEGVPDLDALPELLRSIARGLDGLGGMNPPASSAAAPGSEEHLEAPAAAALPEAPLAPAAPPARPDTVRLEIAELDAVLNGLREAGGRFAAFREEAGTLQKARRLVRDLDALVPEADRAGVGELAAVLELFDRRGMAALERAERELSLAHDRAGRLRLLPAAAVFDFLERVARDAARALGKRVRLECEGGEQRLDAAASAALQDALQHLVRNAVVHGVEEPAARLAAGKDERGLLRLGLSRRGGWLRVLCADDGRGIQPGEVGRVALARGLLSEAEAASLDSAAATALLLKGGLSTAPSLSELSGRGVGLDTVRAAVERLRGSLDVRNRPGLGVEVEIRVPDSLASFETLAVEAGGRTALIPFQAVRGVRGLDPRDFARSPEGERVLLPGGSLPYLPLGPLVSGAPLSPAILGVVVGSGDGEAVLGVERILGLRESVVQPLPELSLRPRFAAGACLDASGAARLVLDPAGLVEEARAARGRACEGPAAEIPPLLVVDDSLTTRMLEQSILETAGYRVDLASSGEEGLEKARGRRYGLILVDVEMPGMNGFEFLGRLAEDAELRDVPAILVTSRNAPEDRRRGEAAGARDYIVKGDFDQDRLLGRIRELLG